MLNKIIILTGQKKFFINQFLYYSNMVIFENNVKHRSDEINKYLENCNDALKIYSYGYVILAYHNPLPINNSAKTCCAG